jgi:hypothetical protein
MFFCTLFAKDKRAMAIRNPGQKEEIACDWLTYFLKLFSKVGKELCKINF